MKFHKKYLNRIFMPFKRKLRKYLFLRLDARYKKKYVNDNFHEQENRKKYQLFCYKFDTRNYKSAAEISKGIDLTLLSNKEKLNIVKCYYSSKYGVIADQLLQTISQDVLNRKDSDTRLIITLLDRISISSLDFREKIKVFEDAKKLFDLTKEKEVFHYYTLLWMEYSLLRQSKEYLDPVEFISNKDIETYGVELIANFMPSLKSFGHEDYVKSLLEKIREKERHTFISLKLLINLSKENLSELSLESISIPLRQENLRFLPILLSGADFNENIKVAYKALFFYAIDNFYSFHYSNQERVLRFMLRNEMYENILDVTKNLQYASDFLPLFVAKGYISIKKDDYYTARSCFEHVLIEDPADALAATGLRFALPRTGRQMKEILNLRDSTGYGIFGKGRIGFRDFGSELTISLLMSGDYIKGQYSKSKSKHWIDLKNYYGEKFLNFERLKKYSKKSIFIIGDEGVGDEIRTSQFYAALVSFYQNVTITCDPRLYKIFKKSFPEIKFLPVARIWKLVETQDVRTEDRLDGFGDKISGYLTEECRQYIDKADILTFGQNVFFNYFLGDITRPKKGAYLSLPYKKNAIKKNSDQIKIKIGILWRSHLRVGARKMMYLDLQEFAPLLNLDGIELWSIQHSIDEDEEEYCERNNIKLINDVDMFNDFDSLGNYLQDLDLLIGVSSVPMELGAALGVETWMLGFSPENYFLRTAGGVDSHDRYTMNSTVIAPPWIDFSNPRSLCVQQVFEEVTRLLKIKLEGADNEAVIN